MNGKKIAVAGVLVVAGFAFAAERGPIVPKQKIMLWNGKDFTGWTFCTRPKVDPSEVWSIQDGVIHCKGWPRGYMRTTADYANYKLHVEWRWVVDEAAKGRKRMRRNSGVLLHMSGKDNVWPRSIECQLMAGNAGDFFVIGGTEFKEHREVVAAAAKRDRGKGKKKRRIPRRVPKKGKSNEKPLGQWNSYDIVCKGNTVTPYVNGKMMNQATETNVSSGKICLQSEGGAIEFRSIYIEPVD